ncbi:MAG: GHKL domain-containing protein [Clostridia bacterium]|nr:GHKL domain-containing protein [Clostridia bacterium]
MWCTLGAKYSGVKTIAAALSCTLAFFAAVTIANYITFFESMGIFVYAAIFFVFALFFLRGSVFKKLLASVIGMCTLAMVSVFSVNVTSVFSGQSAVYLMSEPSVYRLALLLLANLSLILLLYIAYSIFNKNDISLSKSEWLLIAFILAVSIVVFALLYFAVFAGVSEKSKLFIAFSAILIIFIDLFIWSLIVRLSKKHKIELENKLLLRQQSFQSEFVAETKRQYDSLQKMRHDFNNTLRVIQSLNRDGKEEELEEYINSFLNSSARSQSFVSTNNSYVNAIVNTKLSQANSQCIRTSLSIVSDIQCDYNIDLCSILGNMFDNAIEACAKCTDEKFIALTIALDGKTLTITMKNSVPSPVLAQNPTLATTKKDTLLHGHGTKIIKDLAANHRGSADFYEEGNLFCCNVILIL